MRKGVGLPTTDVQGTVIGARLMPEVKEDTMLTRVDL